MAATRKRKTGAKRPSRSPRATGRSAVSSQAPEGTSLTARDVLRPRVMDLRPAVTIDVGETLAQALPVLGRYAFAAGRRAVTWGFVASAQASARVVRAAVAGESPAQLFREFEEELRDYGRRLLGLADAEERLWRIVAPEAAVGTGVPPMAAGDGPPSAAALRARGAELLRRSADVEYVEDSHPAYARIIAELAPDEARILRFLHSEGAQPAVDVRTSRPLNVGTQMVEPGLNMIGSQAGCKHVERVPAYLNNLYRLGLIWFSREPVEDANRYQVLEVQPDVSEAKRRAGRAHTVRRSIQMTPFGTDFCEVCLPR